MPWTARTFKANHWNDATPSQAARAARTANAILGAGGDEGRAIATGIKLAKKVSARQRRNSPQKARTKLGAGGKVVRMPGKGSS